MAKWMTINDAVDAFELYDLYSEIVDSYRDDTDDPGSVAAELYELLEEHEDVYEFSPDQDGEYDESFERNLREAVGVIFDEHGHTIGDDYSDSAMDDDDIADIYDGKYEDRPNRPDLDEFDADEDY